jgi:hypothetical protein
VFSRSLIVRKSNVVFSISMIVKKGTAVFSRSMIVRKGTVMFSRSMIVRKLLSCSVDFFHILNKANFLFNVAF